jgi:GNAT superfamily N-acetyltransferase
VSRSAVLVRELAATDGPALHALWGPMLPQPAPDVTPASYAEHVLTSMQHHPGATVLVAEVEGAVVGAAYLHRSLAAPVAGAEALEVGLLAVAPERTRRGVGRALLERALSHAEHLGLDNVLVAGRPDDRETSRFLARLGLAQVALLRIASVPALRGRLPLDPPGVVGVVQGTRRNRHVGRVIAARRTQRRSRNRQRVS